MRGKRWLKDSPYEDLKEMFIFLRTTQKYTYEILIQNCVDRIFSTIKFEMKFYITKW
jgi:hypothetical protein